MRTVETALAALDQAPHLLARAELLRRWRTDGLHRGLTLAEAVAEGAARHPDTAVVFGSRSHPCETRVGDLHRQARQVAAGLAAQGFTAGDRIVLQMPNRAEGLVAFLAAAHLGLIVVPVIPVYGAAELGHVLRVTQARGLIVPDRWGKFDFAERVAQLPELPALRTIVVVGDATFTRPVILWGELSGHGEIAEPFRGASASACLINFTSGTTSEPKGVVHSHDSLIAEVPSFPILSSRTSAPALWPLPAGHIAGLIAWLRPFLAADPAILIDHWDEQLAYALIEKYRPDRCGAAPFHVDFYLRHGRELFRDGLLHMPIGAASVPPALIERTDAIGFPSTRTYGCTEHPTISGGWPMDPLPRRARTDGRPLKGVELRLIGEDGENVPPGQPGEIVSTGPDLFKGYLDPAHNASAFTADGWFRTGDIGVLTDDGYLTIVDRKKDIVIRGGENISSREVEDVLARHPAIIDAAVVAWPDERYGEKVGAFVTLRPGTALAVQELAPFFRAQGVAVQKTPEHLVVLEALPRNAVGKVVKASLRALAHEMAQRQSA